MTLKIGDLIEGPIEKIAFGGEGILKHQGFILFIPFTAPGDTVLCQVTTLKKSFGRAELVSIRQPSKSRVVPLCPYFGKCGGCQLQHLNDQTQLEYKREAVIDALKRIGRITVDNIEMIPAQLKWAYRRHITLHLRPYEEGFEAGYIGIDHQSFIPIQTCPIFNTKESLVIQHLQSFLRHIPSTSHTEGRVTLLKTHLDQFILSFQFPATISTKIFEQTIKQYPEFVGLIIQTPHTHFVWGDPYSEFTLNDLTFRFTPQTFIQNNPEQSTNIYQELCSIVGHTSPKVILDLYCGFGITSLLFSKLGHQVIGIEWGSEAINFARNNAQINHLPVKFIQGDVEKQIPLVAKSTIPDLILMNPPRIGISREALNKILNIQPKEILYVSCMPATLARDLAIICQKPYRIEKCVVYDMFPQTAHVETLIHLKQIE